VGMADRSSGLAAVLMGMTAMFLPLGNPLSRTVWEIVFLGARGLVLGVACTQAASGWS
jgi:hypothetical protein